MEQEIVHKRGWISREHFLDLLAISNLIPGANAVEMVVHISAIQGGWLGIIAGGVAFIIPAFLISLLFSVIYVQFGSLPAGQALFYGINPIVLAIILVASYRLGKSAIRQKSLLFLGLGAFAATLLNVDEILILIISGIIGIILYSPPSRLIKAPAVVLLPFITSLNQTNIAIIIEDRLIQLTLFFLKVGSLLFGSGMVLFAFIQKDVVDRFGWLTQQQLIDAIAVGQMTPGPVLSSATFIGYLLSGWEGAIIATIAIFLPSFLIVIIIGPLIPRLRKSITAQAFLKGVNAAVVALIFAVSISIFQSAIIDIWTLIIFALGLIALLKFKIDTLWLVIGGAGIGIIQFLLT